MSDYTTTKSDVRAMFDSIAPKYDTINSTLSFGVDRIWRKQLLAMAKGQRFHNAVDIATGTGAFLPALAKISAKVTGVDLSPKMLEVAKRLVRDEKLTSVSLMEGDALALPISSSSADLVTVAFGVRNFEVLEHGLAEICRILQPGGSLLILEFGQPKNILLRWFYQQYSTLVIPLIGGLVSQNNAAYRYLNRTSLSFPYGEDFIKRAEQVGLSCKASQAFFTGIAWGYHFTRSSP